MQMDGVTTVLFERQLRGLRIYGDTLESYLADVRAAMPPEDAEELRRFIETAPLPTPAQNPSLYMLVFGLFEQARDAASAIGMPLEKTPVLGTEMAGELNGFAFSPDGVNHGILFDEHLFVFIYLTAKVVVQLCTDTVDGRLQFTFEREDPAAHLFERREAVERLTEMLLSYLRYGNSSKAHPYRLDDVAVAAATDLTSGAELFCVAHECGHIYHGHLGRPVVAGNNSMMRELEADNYALRVTLAALGGKAQPPRLLGVCGIFVFFIALELLERSVIYASCRADVGEDEDAYSGLLFRFVREPLTHPHPFWRRQQLLTWIGRNLPAFEEQARRMDGAIAHLLSGAFFLMREKLDAELANGLRLHRRWDSVLVDIDALRAHGREVKQTPG